MTPAEEMARLGARARQAARAMAKAHPDAKTRALLGLADLLRQREAEILAANAEDLAAAKAAGQDAPRLDRLTLTPAIMEEMRAACRHAYFDSICGKNRVLSCFSANLSIKVKCYLIPSLFFRCVKCFICP